MLLSLVIVKLTGCTRDLNIIIYKQKQKNSVHFKLTLL